MQPLTTWTCDSCGEQVRPDEGLLIAKSDTQGIKDFHVVHKNLNDKTCDPRRGYNFNYGLHTVLGPDGLTKLLALLSPGPLKGPSSLPGVVDIDEFVDVIRRLQIPFYEQARPWFETAAFAEEHGDSNEYRPYMVDTLEYVAEGNLDA